LRLCVLAPLRLKVTIHEVTGTKHETRYPGKRILGQSYLKQESEFDYRQINP